MQRSRIDMEIQLVRRVQTGEDHTWTVSYVSEAAIG